MDYRVAIEREIEEIHTFFESWFNGARPQTDRVFDELESRLHADFHIVMPSGDLLTRSQLLAALRRGWGTNPKFRIRTRLLYWKPSGVGTWLAVYEEWQKAARNSAPANNGRVTSAVFIPADSAPNRVAWLHAHETWLPAAAVAAAAFDF